MHIVDDERRNDIVLDHGVKGGLKVNFGTLPVKPCGHGKEYSYFPMMRGGTLLILGHRVKGQGQLWYSVYKTLLAWYSLQFFAQLLLNL